MDTHTNGYNQTHIHTYNRALSMATIALATTTGALATTPEASY